MQKTSDPTPSGMLSISTAAWLKVSGVNERLKPGTLLFGTTKKSSAPSTNCAREEIVRAASSQLCNFNLNVIDSLLIGKDVALLDVTEETTAAAAEASHTAQDKQVTAAVFGAQASIDMSSSLTGQGRQQQSPNTSGGLQVPQETYRLFHMWNLSAWAWTCFNCHPAVPQAIHICRK